MKCQQNVSVKMNDDDVLQSVYQLTVLLLHLEREEAVGPDSFSKMLCLAPISS